MTRPAGRRTSAPRLAAYWALRAVLRPPFRACFGMRGVGLEHIPRHGPYLLAYNHVSMLDWAFVSYFLARPVRFAVDRDYFDRRLLRLPMWINGALGVHTDRRDVGLIRAARGVLAAGEPLALTPEGRISRDGRPGVGQPGIIALAMAAQVPILPAAIRGAFDVFPRHRSLPRPGGISVVFAEPLPPPLEADRSAQRALVGRLMGYIEGLLDDLPQPARPW